MFDGQAIAGEYPFGSQPPKELMGWLGPEEEKRSMAQLEELGLTTSLADVLPLVATDEPPGPPVWELAEKFFGGQQMPTPRQETGDCTCVAEKVEKQFRQIVQIVEQYREEKYRPVFSPFTYYTARQKVLQGRIRGAGATGAAVAEAVNRYGTLFEDDVDVPPYSGRIADLWGNGHGGVEQFEPVAVDNPVRKVVRLKTVEEIRLAIQARHLVLIASSRGFRMQPVNFRGFHVFVPQGTWMHQMTLLAWMDDPFPAAYRGNQWGANAHGQPLNGEWPGGAWNRAEDLEQELRGGSVEVYCYWDFEAEPGPADHRIVR
jgi:hypothetical protein